MTRARASRAAADPPTPVAVTTDSDDSYNDSISGRRPRYTLPLFSITIRSM